jgi:hypothetical protein
VATLLLNPAIDQRRFEVKKALIIVGCTMALAACKAKDKDVANNVRVATESTELQGQTFQGACNEDPLTGVFSDMQSHRVQYKFTGDNVHRLETYYMKKGCVEDGVQFDESGTFAVHRNNRTNDGGIAIDFHFTDLNATPLSDAGAQGATKGKWCAPMTWSKGNANDVTKLASQVDCYQGPEPRDFYNVYRVDGNKLLLGSDVKAKNTENERPTALQNKPFTK